MSFEEIEHTADRAFRVQGETFAKLLENAARAMSSLDRLKPTGEPSVVRTIEAEGIDGCRIRVCIHRKGATRAFGPGSSVLPEDLRDIGQPVLIPGSMGTASYVLIGTTEAMRQTFGSTCHRAGRVMSRARLRRWSGEQNYTTS
jgi:tRNA-splicing ligase RtcB/archease protein family (MTH1598/TM1083)